MGGAICTRAEHTELQTKELFQLRYDMEQASLVEVTEKYKLYRLSMKAISGPLRKKWGKVNGSTTPTL